MSETLPEPKGNLGVFRFSPDTLHPQRDELLLPHRESREKNENIQFSLFPLSINKKGT